MTPWATETAESWRAPRRPTKAAVTVAMENWNVPVSIAGPARLHVCFDSSRILESSLLMTGHHLGGQLSPHPPSLCLSWFTEAVLRSSPAACARPFAVPLEPAKRGQGRVGELLFSLEVGTEAAWLLGLAWLGPIALSAWQRIRRWFVEEGRTRTHGRKDPNPSARFCFCFLFFFL